MADEDDKTLMDASIDKKPPPGFISRVVWLPFTLTSRVLASLALSVRPLVPHLIPLLVGLSIVPLLALLSSGAGFYVWKTAAVSWETPLFLQYG
jgi:hypothetical protein